jgi:hypothetical protein
VLDLIVTRSVNQTFTVYFVIDGVVQLPAELEVPNSGNASRPAVVDDLTRLGFFFDDAFTEDEATPGGKVYGIKLWNEPLYLSTIATAMKRMMIQIKNNHHKECI